jgi:acetyl esterase/lipase
MSAAVSVQRDLEFARHGDEPLLLDLYLPDTEAGQVPLVVYLHAGGWMFGDRTFGAQARGEALARSGVALASIDYRLAPGHQYPAQLQDAKAAIGWLGDHRTELGLKTDRVGAWGASAGGQLAAMLGVVDDDEAPVAAAVACYFPIVDLAATGTRSGVEREVVPEGTEASYLGLERVADDFELARAASPRHQALAGASPFLLVHGDRDQMVSIDQSRSFHDALTNAGIPSQLLTIGGAGHEGELFDEPALLAYVAGFFAGHLAG